MSKKLFREADQKLLFKNPFVSKISERCILFTEECKRLFIDQHREGNSPRDILENNGIDIHIMGMTRVEQCADRWRKAYKKNGMIGLSDARKGASVVPRKGN